MNILIVGGGIGGLSLAAFLGKRGIAHEIVEKQPEWNRYGYAIGLWSNGRDMLQKLGIERVFDEESVRMATYSLRTTKGEELLTFSFDEFKDLYGHSYANLPRASLHDALRTCVNLSVVRLGVTVTKISQDADGATVTFSDGSRKTYDLVVGADGIHSTVRSLMFPAGAKQSSGYTAWFVSLTKKVVGDNEMIQCFGDGQFMAVFDDHEGSLCVYVTSTPSDMSRSTVFVRERLKELPWLVPDDAFPEDADKIRPVDIANVKLHAWVKGRTVLLGDAAHAMEPHGGLGASMAMEDAYVLAQELAKARDGAYSIGNALTSYEGERMRRVALARFATENLNWWTMIRSSVLQRVIYFVARRISASLFTAPLHRLMRERL